MYISAYTTHPTASPALIHSQTKWGIALPMEMGEVHCSSISGIGLQPRVTQKIYLVYFGRLDVFRVKQMVFGCALQRLSE